MNPTHFDNICISCAGGTKGGYAPPHAEKAAPRRTVVLLGKSAPSRARVVLFQRLTHESPVPAKAWLPISCNFAGNSTKRRLLQPTKAFGPIAAKLELLSNRTVASDAQSRKAEALMCVTWRVSGPSAQRRLEQCFA